MTKLNPLFNKVQAKEPPRSRFDLSHENKLSCNMGELVPALTMECLPGDKFKVQSEDFVRLLPLLAPIMHRVDVTMHYFFVPNRLLWDNGKDDCWETFITGGKDGYATPTPPIIRLKGQYNSATDTSWIVSGSLADYLGINVQNRIGENEDFDMIFSALPFRAYFKIYLDYYRDENLNQELEPDITGGVVDFDESVNNVMMQLHNRAWEKDYFTSALPWVQRGDPMAIPFTQSNNLVTLDKSGNYPFLDLGGSSSGEFANSSFTFVGVDADSSQPDLLVGGEITSQIDEVFQTSHSAYFNPNGSLKVNIDNVATIQDLRIASKIQRWEEAHGLSGARYNETIMVDFFTKVPDYRLQRAEYLGGGVTPVNINEVLQTSESGDTPLGEMGGHAVSAGGDNGFYYYVQEHGFIMGILSILPKPAYMQGLHKMWTRFDKFDYAFPRLQGIGEQPVYRRELLFFGRNNNMPGTTVLPDYLDDDNGVFGYQGQNADYKFMLDEVHGDFKTTLSFWHMARKFNYDNKALLDTDFVTFDESQICNPFTSDLNGGRNHFLCDLYFHIEVSRYLPFWSDPKLN